MVGNQEGFVSVDIDGRSVGQAFGSGSRFYFLLDDRIAVDRPRGQYRTIEEAVTACQQQARCLAMAEVWDDRKLMMLDT
jgi:hypothetical protein